MAARKYDLTVPVDWKLVMKLFRWRLGVLIRDVEYLVRCYHCDQVHSYPESLGILELLDFYDAHFWDSLEIGNVPPPTGNIYFYPD